MGDDEFIRSLPVHGGAIVLVRSISGAKGLHEKMVKHRGKDFMKTCRFISIPDAGWINAIEGVTGPVYIHDSFLEGNLHPALKNQIIKTVNVANSFVRRPPVYEVIDEAS